MPKRTDHRSAEAKQYRRLYGTKQWQDIRERRKAEEPLCRRCLSLGFTVPMEACDHIKPHRGDPVLFFDYNNTQSLCASCHDIDKGHIEAHGFSKAVGADGYPTDPQHPINRPRSPQRLH
jgi:5-methylcytosine-specific restriction protein A